MGKRNRGNNQNQGGNNQGQRGGRRVENVAAVRKPDCPPNFRCHQCEANHWTVDCPRIRREPHRFPKIDLLHGCYQCGQRGHAYAKCAVRREKCRECHGMHATESCPFTYIPQEWHEFFDTNRQRVYYALATATTTTVSWSMPLNPLDIILWHCDTCKILLPDTIKECVQCHGMRPVSVFQESEDEESDEDGDEEEEEDGNSSSSHHEEEGNSKEVQVTPKDEGTTGDVEVVAETLRQESSSELPDVSSSPAEVAVVVPTAVDPPSAAE